MPEQSINIRIKFKPEVTSPTLEVAHADYRRMFSASDQPFTAARQEYDQHLARLNLFDIAPDPIPTAKPAEAKSISIVKE